MPSVCARLKCDRSTQQTGALCECHTRIRIPACPNPCPCRKASKCTTPRRSYLELLGNRSNSNHSICRNQRRSRSRLRSPSCSGRQGKVGRSASRCSCASNRCRRPTSPYHQRCVPIPKCKVPVCSVKKKCLNNYERMRPRQTKFSNDKLINERLIISPVLISERRHFGKEKDEKTKMLKCKPIVEHSTPQLNTLNKSKHKIKPVYSKNYEALFTNTALEKGSTVLNKTDVNTPNPTQKHVKHSINYETMFSSRYSLRKSKVQPIDKPIIGCEEPRSHVGRHVSIVSNPPRFGPKYPYTCEERMNAKKSCVKDLKTELFTNDINRQSSESTEKKLKTVQKATRRPNISDGLSTRCRWAVNCSDNSSEVKQSTADQNEMCIMCPSVVDKPVSAIVSHYDKETDCPAQKYTDDWTAISKHIPSVNHLPNSKQIDPQNSNLKGEIIVSNSDKEADSPKQQCTDQLMAVSKEIPYVNHLISKQIEPQISHPKYENLCPIDAINTVKAEITQTSSMLHEFKRVDYNNQPIINPNFNENSRTYTTENGKSVGSVFIPTKFWENEKETMSYEYDKVDELDCASLNQLSWPSVNLQKALDEVLKGIVDRVNGINDTKLDKLLVNDIFDKMDPNAVSIERMLPKLSTIESVNREDEEINELPDYIIEPPSSFRSFHSRSSTPKYTALVDELKYKLQSYSKKCNSQQTLITYSLIQSEEKTKHTSNLKVEFTQLAKHIKKSNSLAKDAGKIVDRVDAVEDPLEKMPAQVRSNPKQLVFHKHENVESEPTHCVNEMTDSATKCTGEVDWKKINTKQPIESGSPKDAIILPSSCLVKYTEKALVKKADVKKYPEVEKPVPYWEIPRPPPAEILPGLNSRDQVSFEGIIKEDTISDTPKISQDIIAFLDKGLIQSKSSNNTSKQLTSLSVERCSMDAVEKRQNGNNASATEGEMMDVQYWEIPRAPREEALPKLNSPYDGYIETISDNLPTPIAIQEPLTLLAIEPVAQKSPGIGRKELTCSSLVRNLVEVVEKKHDKKNTNTLLKGEEKTVGHRELPGLPKEVIFPRLDSRDGRFIEGVSRNNENISVQFPERPVTNHQEAATDDIGCSTRTVRSTAN